MSLDHAAVGSVQQSPARRSTDPSSPVMNSIVALELIQETSGEADLYSVSTGLYVFTEKSKQIHSLLVATEVVRVYRKVETN